MKMLPSSGFGRFTTHKDAARFATRKAAEGCAVNIRQEIDGKYRVVFYDPQIELEDAGTVMQRSLRDRPL